MDSPLPAPVVLNALTAQAFSHASLALVTGGASGAVLQARTAQVVTVMKELPHDPHLDTPLVDPFLAPVLAALLCAAAVRVSDRFTFHRGHSP